MARTTDSELAHELTDRLDELAEKLDEVRRVAKQMAEDQETK